MARISYLLRRGASYYARLKVPTDLVEILGKKELVKSLGTKDEHEAKRLMWPVVEEWNRQFDDLRSRRELTDADKAHATWQHYETTLDRYERAQKSLPTQDDIENEKSLIMQRAHSGEIKNTESLTVFDATLDLEVLKRAKQFNEDTRRNKLEALKQQLSNNETALISPQVNAYTEANRLLVNEPHDDWKDVARRMIRAEVEALQRTFERDTGDYSGIPKDPIVKPVTGTARETAARGESIMELFENYALENPRKISPDTINQARRDVGMFVDHIGRTAPVQRIDKKALREWKALLMRFPVKATESKAFAGMTTAQMVKHNEEIGKPVLTPRTVNRYLSNLGAFCNWLVNHGYLDQNPLYGMLLAKEKKISTYPFTSVQLNKLFQSPLFTGCHSANEWRFISRQGDVKIRDHRYWVPLIMLFSGARPAEIAQLSIDDVRQEHGHWIMHITTEGDGDKTVKTAGSMRVVPIHKELIKLGFLDYHAGMKKAGQPRLFPFAERNSRGQMIADFSREFSRYLIRIGIKIGRGLSLYSFRHGAADALRRAGYLDEQFGFILGHTSGTMTGRYGIMPQGMLEQRVELVNAIAYPDLKIDHLI